MASWVEPGVERRASSIVNLAARKDGVGVIVRQKRLIDRLERALEQIASCETVEQARRVAGAALDGEER